MRKLVPVSSVLLALLLAAGIACSNDHKAPDVTANIRQGLDQAGLNSVRVSQDRDKGVVTLSGDVPSDNQKTQAESIARSDAGTQVVANEIAVRPQGDNTAGKIDSDQDKAIEKNLDAKLVRMNLNHDVRYEVKNGVVTLKGNVPSQSERSSVEKAASGVPDVKQVVNELEVRHQKATSTGQ
jgi:hyperosmotically inducible protein